MAEYGHLQSFYYDKGYTECRKKFELPPSKRKDSEAEAEAEAS